MKKTIIAMQVESNFSGFMEADGRTIKTLPLFLRSKLS
jgi:hypothetical protein